MTVRVASKSPTVIDGLSSVRAVRRSGDAPKGPRTRSTPARLPGQTRPPPDSTGSILESARIGHTVLPEKHDIVCYECSYAFRLQGKIKDTYCPKCRKVLKVADFTIDGEWSRDLKTIGTIEIKPGSVVRNASLTALHIVLAGDIEQAAVKWCQVLDLHPGAKLNLDSLSIRDLNVIEGATIRLRQKLTCRNVEVRGTLKAPAYLSGHLKILPGGMFGGELHGNRLIVEDGGAMKAKVFMSQPEAKQKKHDKR